MRVNMRLIDADKLKENIRTQKDDNDRMCRMCIESMCEIVDDEPTAQVRANVIDECIEEVWRISKSTTDANKHLMYENVVKHLERLKD